MRIDEFEGVTKAQLNALENVLDKVFAKLGIDVEFTRHFLDRVNDERNIKQITIKELGQLFAKEFKKWGKPIAQMGPDAEAVMKDLSSDINLPFALNWNKQSGMLELVAKTVMRKKNFRTPNKEFPVESAQLDELSPDTMTNYIGKASDARRHRKLPSHKVDNRYAGVARADIKLDRENRGIKKGDFVTHNGKLYRVFGFTGRILDVGEYYGPDSYGGTHQIHITKAKKAEPPMNEHDDPSSYVKTIRKAGYSIYVSKIAGGEGGLRFEVETPSGKEFDVIERETGQYELFANGPTMSGKGEVFGSLMDAIRAAETENINEARPNKVAEFDGPGYKTVKIYKLPGGRYYGDTGDFDFERDSLQSLKATLNKWGYKKLAWGSLGEATPSPLGEDIGSIPPLADLIVMAVIGQTTVAALKAAWKTGKYALKLKRLADKAGVKLNRAVMGESNPFTDARMNAIKAGKKEFTVNGKKYRVTGDTSDEEEAIANEAVNRDDYAAKLAAKQQDKFFAAALSALDRLVKSDPRGQDVGGYAFDIARAFQGINGKELVRAYNENQ